MLFLQKLYSNGCEDTTAVIDLEQSCILYFVIEVRKGGCIGSWWGNRREREHWGDLGVDGWIILGWISRRWDVGILDWIGLAQDTDRWRTLVSAVMNLRVP